MDRNTVSRLTLCGILLATVGVIALYRLSTAVPVKTPARAEPEPVYAPPPDRWLRLRLATREPIDFDDLDPKDATLKNVLSIIAKAYDVKVDVRAVDFVADEIPNVDMIPVYRIWWSRASTLDQLLRAVIVHIPTDAAYAVVGKTIQISTLADMERRGIRPAPRPTSAAFERRRQETMKVLATVVEFPGTGEFDPKDHKLGNMLDWVAKKSGFTYRFHERLGIERETGALKDPSQYEIKQVAPLPKCTVEQVITALLAQVPNPVKEDGKLIVMVAKDGDVLITTTVIREDGWVSRKVIPP